MSRLPRVTLKIDGMDELGALLEKVAEQARELEQTVEDINRTRFEIQAKINQPEADTTD